MFVLLEFDEKNVFWWEMFEHFDNLLSLLLKLPRKFNPLFFSYDYFDYLLSLFLWKFLWLSTHYCHFDVTFTDSRQKKKKRQFENLNSYFVF